MCVKFSMQTSIPCRGGGIHCMEENVLPKESHGIGIAKEQSEQSHLSSSPFSTSATFVCILSCDPHRGDCVGPNKCQCRPGFIGNIIYNTIIV